MQLWKKLVNWKIGQKNIQTEVTDTKGWKRTYDEYDMQLKRLQLESLEERTERMAQKKSWRRYG